jgi:hypothetical protein
MIIWGWSVAKFGKWVLIVIKKARKDGFIEICLTKQAVFRKSFIEAVPAPNKNKALIVKCQTSNIKGEW